MMNPLLVMRVRDPRLRRWLSRRPDRSPGLPPRYERAFDGALAAILLLMAIGWGVAAGNALATGQNSLLRHVAANPMSRIAAPEVAYLLDAVVQRLTAAELYRGLSGQVRIIVQDPDDDAPGFEGVPDDIQIRYREIGPDAAAEPAPIPQRPGVWNVLIGARGALREVPDLFVLRTVPLAERREGRVGRYRIGEWPFEQRGRPETPAYAPPRGLVEVTPENQDLRVSRHFRLRDFLTKGQDEVWPKYVLISPRLLDKLELVIDELERMGHPVRRVGIISGFRTPYYNAAGGDPRGRGSLSRHMYGDAMDFFIDNDGDGQMDDLNGDGRVTVADLRIVAEAAERVERRHPELIGGIGVYPPVRGSHSGFVHIDTRGFRARW
jgi:uncharacterized protein YcbK (DUF882 family)